MVEKYLLVEFLHRPKMTENVKIRRTQTSPVLQSVLIG